VALTRGFFIDLMSDLFAEKQRRGVSAAQMPNDVANQGPLLSQPVT
jgi:hypothetical protein